MKLEYFIEQLQKIYGGNLCSIILYGSAAGSDFQKNYSDINLMIILKEIGADELGRVAKLVQKWMGAGNPIPLFADREYLDTSHDVFPLEFLDIQESHRVLFGEDPFSTLKIAMEHLRLECESELKSKILALRAQFLQIHPDNGKIRKLLLASISSLFAVFRGMLRLRGITPPLTKREVLEALKTKTDFDTTIFEKILAVREEKGDLPKNEVLQWFDDYLTTLKKMARVADTL